MIHIRIDDFDDNSKRQFACGIGPELPEGDIYFFAGEGASRRADCPGCNPGGPQPLGTPISELSGQPGSHGFKKFSDIAASWGHD
jgi:hypothetical protein